MPYSFAFFITISAIAKPTIWPNFRCPSTMAVVGVSLTISIFAPGTIFPIFIWSRYCGMRMTPWES